MSLPLATLRSALVRKLRRWTGQERDPYADIPDGVQLSASPGLHTEMTGADRALALPTDGDPTVLTSWQKEAHARLDDLSGYHRFRVAPAVVLRDTAASLGGDIALETVYLRVRDTTDIPVTHLARAGLPAMAPVFLYMAGSTSGVHVGWGEARVPIDHQRIAIGADIALQAARRGYRVFCIEQLGFGTRAERALPKRSVDRTIDAHNHALLLGRSLMGLRTTDVSSVIDWLKSGEAPCAADVRISLYGHSSGGMAALYAAALDDRIDGVLASGSVGPVLDTVGARGNSSGDGIIPGMLKFFDTADIVALIAPRPFVGLSGKDDHIFPYSGVHAVVEEARTVYRGLGVPDSVLAVEAPAGHRYYAPESWAAWKAIIDPALPDDPVL